MQYRNRSKAGDYAGAKSMGQAALGCNIAAVVFFFISVGVIVFALVLHYHVIN